MIANREKVLPWIKEYSPIELVTQDDPPIYLDYPNQKTPPKLGQEETDPTHSAMYGVQAGREARLGRRRGRRFVSRPRGQEVRLDQEVPDRQADHRQQPMSPVALQLTRSVPSFASRGPTASATGPRTPSATGPV